jgi:hypothetical protein
VAPDGMIDFGSDQGYLPYTPARMTTSMMCVWAGLAMAAVLGTALAMDLPAAAECALTQAGGGAPGGFRGGTPDPAAGELDNAWVMHSLAELIQENEKRKAELQREKDERKAEQRQMQRVIKSQQWQIEDQQGQIKNLTATAGRRLQIAGNTMGPGAARDFVRIFKRTLTTAGGADGHRRLRVLAEVECSKAYIKKQTNRINDECCDEPSEDCSAGIIGVCNAGCAALVNLLWAACQVELGPAAAVLAAAANRCSAPTPSSPASSTAPSSPGLAPPPSAATTAPIPTPSLPP